jgi:hypothetical protein
MNTSTAISSAAVSSSNVASARRASALDVALLSAFLRLARKQCPPSFSALSDRVDASDLEVNESLTRLAAQGFVYADAKQNTFRLSMLGFACSVGLAGQRAPAQPQNTRTTTAQATAKSTTVATSEKPRKNLRAA